MYIQVMVQGFLLGISLILAIGAQNVLIIRYGIARQHVFILCLICAVSDALLILIGVAGLHKIFEVFGDIKHILTWIGAAWLFLYGGLRLRSVFLRHHLRQLDGDHGVEMEQSTLRDSIILCLLLTWANPHVYLDTVVLIGSIANTNVGDGKWFFGIGAMISSFVFFFSLGYGASICAPLMKSHRAWQIFDGAAATVMFAIAILLLYNHG